MFVQHKHTILFYMLNAYVIVLHYNFKTIAVGIILALHRLLLLCTSANIIKLEHDLDAFQLWTPSAIAGMGTPYALSGSWIKPNITKRQGGKEMGNNVVQTMFSF